MDELVAAAQTGDKQAFAQVVKGRSKLVLHLAATYLGWQEAPDAAQDIWAAVWRKLWQLKQSQSFDAWLRTLVMHRCLNWRKNRARRQSQEVQLAPEAWLALTECTLAPGPSPEQIAENGELRRFIRRELAKLPGEYGLLLQLYYCEDLSYQAISELTGLALGTLKWRLHQGRKLFRANLTLNLQKLCKGE